MQRIRTTSAIALLTLGTIAFAEPTTTTADLSPALTVGQKGSWVVTRSVTEKSKAAAATGESDLTATLEFTTHVRSTPTTGGAIVEVKFSRIAVKGDGTRWVGAFDSSDPASVDAKTPDDFDRAFRDLVGHPVEITLDAFGLATDARGLGERENRDPTAATIAQAVLGLEALDRTIGPILAIKPESPFTVATGETFDDTSDSMLDVGRVLTRAQYTLAGVNGTTAELTIGGRTELFGNNNTPVSPKITSQKIEGAAGWNTERHALTAYAVKIDWALEAGGKEFPITFNRSETITIAPAKTK